MDQEQLNNQQQPVTPPTQEVPGVVNSNATQVGSSGGKKKLFVVLAIIATILLLVGGSAAAYFLVYLPNKPENVLAQALYNTASRSEVKSAKFDGTLKVSGENLPEKLGDIDLNASMAQNGDFDLSISTDLDGATLTGEVRAIGENDTYLKINGLKNIDKIIKSLNLDNADSKETLSLISPLFGKLDDQWIKIDQTSDQITGGATNTLDVLDLSKEDADKVAQAYLDNPVIQITEVMADEDVNGEDSFHYKTTINKDNYVAFLNAIKDANIEKLKVDQSEIEVIKDQDFSKLNLEIWVKKSDKTINQIKVSGTEDNVNIEFRLAITNINEDIKIEVPEGAKTIEEIFSSSFTPTSTTPSSPLLESSI